MALESWNGIYQVPISLKIVPNHPDGFTGSHLTGLDPEELSKDHLRLIKTVDKRVQDKENPGSFFADQETFAGSPADLQYA